MHKWMTKRQIFIFLQWENIKGDDNFELNDFGIVNMPMNYEKLFTHSSMIKYEKTDDFLGFWYWKLDQHKISFHIPFFFLGPKTVLDNGVALPLTMHLVLKVLWNLIPPSRWKWTYFFPSTGMFWRSQIWFTDKGFTKMRVLLTNVLWASWYIDLHWWGTSRGWTLKTFT